MTSLILQKHSNVCVGVTKDDLIPHGYYFEAVGLPSRSVSGQASSSPVVGALGVCVPVEQTARLSALVFPNPNPRGEVDWLGKAMLSSDKGKH